MEYNPPAASQSNDFDLDRFVEAQANIYNTVLTELRNGDKQSHWMWFIFPQIDGLGTSVTARRYAIKSTKEAEAYLNHPVLGPRLLECTSIVAETEGRTTNEIFGFPDYVKLQSCMTLFSTVRPQEAVFARVLAKYYDNEKDTRTMEILNKPV